MALLPEYKEGEKITLICVWGNFFLTLIKIVAGYWGHSKAMIADGIHSASDVLATLVVFIGLKIAQKPADENHLYGHGKIEFISASVVGFILLSMGLLIIRSSYLAIRTGDYLTPTYLALAAAIVSIVTKEIMFRITYRVGNKINSDSIKANAWDHRSDVYSSLGTLLGIGGSMAGRIYNISYLRILDPLAGIIVGMIILKIAIEIVKSAYDGLMDRAPDTEIIEKIRLILDVNENVLDYDNIRARYLGPKIYLDMCITVDSDYTVEEAHNISGEIKEEIYRNIDKIEEIFIHVDPS